MDKESKYNGFGSSFPEWLARIEKRIGSKQKQSRPEYIDPPVLDTYPLPDPPSKHEFITEEEIPLSDRDKWNTYVKESGSASKHKEADEK